MDTDPGRNRINAAVVYLTRNTPTRRIYLQTSLYFLFRAFNEQFKYPVLIFHQGDFADDAIAAVQEGIPGGLGSLVHFKEIDPGDFRPPGSIGEETVRANRIIVPDARGLNYRMMCRWWVRHLPSYLSPYELYMRLDDDSFIEERLDYDPFQAVKDAAVDYASNLVHIEHPLNSLGLETLSRRVWGESDRLASLFLRCQTAEIIDPGKLKKFLACIPASMRDDVNATELSTPVIYYNNFHIARTAIWSDPDICRYFAEVDRSDGILHMRWGDAALHAVALVCAKNLKIARFSFRYSKRYEREQGSYVNTDHPVAKRYFDSTGISLPTRPDERTGSMTDFAAFNGLLEGRGLGDLVRRLP